MTTLRTRLARKTETRLGHQYGPDRGRSLVVSLVPNPHGDLIEIRPHGTRRAEVLLVSDVYRLALNARVNRERLEHAREVKARRAAARTARREAAAWKRTKGIPV